MAQKLHLDAGLLRIHRLHCEAFGLYDLYGLLMLRLLLKEGFAEGKRTLFLINEFCFIFFDLTFDDLFHKVNGNIHIIGILFGTDDAAFDRDRYLNFLASFLYAHGYLYFRIRRKIAFQLSDLIFCCFF